MPGATPTYGLPYPIGTDRLDAAVTTIPQSLATQLESTLLAFGGIAAPAAWVAAPLVGWASFGGGLRVAQYRKEGTRVHLRGTIVNAGAYAANAAIFTLPVGFRPTQTEVFMQAAGISAGSLRVDVDSGGKVYSPFALPAGTYVALSNMTFFLD